MSLVHDTQTFFTCLFPAFFAPVSLSLLTKTNMDAWNKKQEVISEPSSPLRAQCFVLDSLFLFTSVVESEVSFRQ